MWLGEQTARSRGGQEAAALGTVTAGGLEPAVYAAGEVRQMAVIGPGCYWWAPRAEESALVLRAGTQGEESCLAGRAQDEAPVELAAGEAVLACGGGYIHLRGDGSIYLHGSIVIDGTLAYAAAEEQEDET